MATKAELDALYQETLGRNADSHGLATRAGQSVAQARAEILASEEFAKRTEERARNEEIATLTENIANATAAGERWYAGGMDTGTEFGASSGGDWVFLKSDQRVGEEYLDITEQLGTYVPKGYRAYIDQGTSTGLMGLLDQTFGTDVFSSSWDRFMPNEIKATWGPTANLAMGGSTSVNDAGDAFGDLFGTQREEYAQYGAGFEKAVVTLAATATGQFWAIPAFTAAQGSVQKTSGLQMYKDLEWSDIAENTAWDAAAAYLATGAFAAGEGLKLAQEGSAAAKAFQSTKTAYDIAGTGVALTRVAAQGSTEDLLWDIAGRVVGFGVGAATKDLSKVGRWAAQESAKNIMGRVRGEDEEDPHRMGRLVAGTAESAIKALVIGV